MCLDWTMFGNVLTTAQPIARSLTGSERNSSTLFLVVQIIRYFAPWSKKKLDPIWTTVVAPWHHVNYLFLLPENYLRNHLENLSDSWPWPYSDRDRKRANQLLPVGHKLRYYVEIQSYLSLDFRVNQQQYPNEFKNVESFGKSDSSALICFLVGR